MQATALGGLAAVARRQGDLATAEAARDTAGLIEESSTKAAQGTTKVEADGQMIMVKGAKYMMSAGDEPGSIGGIISGVFKSECEFLMYSFDVMLEGKNVCRMGDPLWHNKKNICG